MDLSPELLRAVAFFALLLGPTSLWLLLRAFRGLPGARNASGHEERGEDWVCAICSSVNLAGADRCYKGCSPTAAPREARGAEPRPLVAVGPGVRAEQTRPEPVGPAIPVGPAVAVGVGPEPPRAVTGSAAPVISSRTVGSTVGGPSAEAPLSRGPSEPTRPGPAAGAYVSPRHSGAPAPQGNGGSEKVSAAPEPADPMAALEPAGWAGAESHETCPFLGLRRDRLTHFEFADAEHRCHADSAARAVTLEQQRAHCLGQYLDCPRYRARTQLLPSAQP